VEATVAKILVVDDNDELRILIGQSLKLAGHEVSEAPNGIAALRRIRDQPPDLVLSDIIMPDMDGLELILKMKQEFPFMRILAMTGGGLTDADLCLSLASHFGAHDTLLKPFTRKELLEKVSSLLQA
jgi:CheY-like chemotaxis protein